MNILKGKLTYIMAAVSILYGVLGFFTEQVGQVAAVNAIWLGLAVFGVRRAIH